MKELKKSKKTISPPSNSKEPDDCIPSDEFDSFDYDLFLLMLKVCPKTYRDWASMVI